MGTSSATTTAAAAAAKAATTAATVRGGTGVGDTLKLTNPLPDLLESILLLVAPTYHTVGEQPQQPQQP